MRGISCNVARPLLGVAPYGGAGLTGIEVLAEPHATLRLFTDVTHHRHDARTSNPVYSFTGFSVLAVYPVGSQVGGGGAYDTDASISAAVSIS
jgi:hypothetical protein